MFSKESVRAISGRYRVRTYDLSGGDSNTPIFALFLSFLSQLLNSLQNRPIPAGRRSRVFSLIFDHLWASCWILLIRQVALSCLRNFEVDRGPSWTSNGFLAFEKCPSCKVGG